MNIYKERFVFLLLSGFFTFQRLFYFPNVF